MAAPTQNPAPARDPDEVLKGAEAIGAVLKLNRQQTYYHLEQGHIPGARKLGRCWIATRRNILKVADGTGI
jgi:hypothetical protein